MAESQTEVLMSLLSDFSWNQKTSVQTFSNVDVSSTFSLHPAPSRSNQIMSSSQLACTYAALALFDDGSSLNLLIIAER